MKGKKEVTLEAICTLLETDVIAVIVAMKQKLEDMHEEVSN